MTYLVKKAFKTTQRKFKPGDEIAVTDDLSPHTIATAKVAGLIDLKPEPKQESVAGAKASD